MSEMFQAAAHLPNPVVRLLPVRFEKFHQQHQEAPFRVVGLDSRKMSLIHRVQDFAKNVELKLFGRRVPDPHRF